jgi:predicted PurR-regulated permease PerM
MSAIRSPEYFSNFTVVYKFFGDFGVSFIFAFILALMFEYPALRVIKIFKDKSRNIAE